ncbi:MAG: hypothetical protein GY859_01895 [Desulfobacterales bacterium]|nr:hypothetical protein [Desulfobacterales bacterium]
MEFPDLFEEKEKLTAVFSRERGVDRGDVRVIASPYRISPLGAHIDHQGGPVLGMTVNAYTLMAYTPANDGKVRLRTLNYPGSVAFDLDRIPAMTSGSWGGYARGAALALKENLTLERGFTGLLDGMLPGCGLSSSASVLLAYLYALADVNGARPEPWDYVRFTQRAENKYIGLNNGILDQTSIVFGRRGRLIHIDTRNEAVRLFEDGPGEDAYRILIAYSGHSRELTATGYNSRVQECREAAGRLARLDGGDGAEILSDLSEDVFRRRGEKLAPHLHRRAAHFFSEARRVRDGLEAWRGGRLARFGALMFESCQSSIEQYECGIPAIHDLQRIVRSTRGVMGSRFSGGGFGGCVVGLVAPAHAEAAVEEIAGAYRRLHPKAAGHAAVYLTESADGVRFL